MWETGKAQPDNDMLIKLSDIFNTSIDYLLGRTDDPINYDDEEFISDVLDNASSDIVRHFNGVALTGTEVKSVRAGQANLKDSYGLLKDGELWLLNCHIGPYDHGNIFNHAPLRTRKLLVHKEEIRKLIGKTQQKGLTLIPTRLYFKNGRVKVELALAKGKQLWDKRETERRRTADKEAREAVNRSRKGR
jgi:SsrA-binding protein